MPSLFIPFDLDEYEVVVEAEVGDVNTKLIII